MCSVGCEKTGTSNELCPHFSPCTLNVARDEVSPTIASFVPLDSPVVFFGFFLQAVLVGVVTNPDVFYRVPAARLALEGVVYL